MDLEDKSLRINQWDLGFTIFVCVLLANIVTIVVVFTYMNHEAEAAMKELNEQAIELKQKTQKKMESLNKQSQIQQQQQAIINERNRNAHRIRNETCKFWIQQVNKENTERTREMKKRACSF